MLQISGADFSSRLFAQLSRATSPSEIEAALAYLTRQIPQQDKLEELASLSRPFQGRQPPSARESLCVKEWMEGWLQGQSICMSGKGKQSNLIGEARRFRAQRNMDRQDSTN